jgi:hypothetical protein
MLLFLHKSYYVCYLVICDASFSPDDVLLDSHKLLVVFAVQESTAPASAAWMLGSSAGVRLVHRKWTLKLLHISPPPCPIKLYHLPLPLSTPSNEPEQNQLAVALKEIRGSSPYCQPQGCEDADKDCDCL